MRFIRAIAAVGIVVVCRLASAEPSTVTVKLATQGIKQPIKGSITFRAAMGPAAPVVLACCNDVMSVALPPRTAWEVIPSLEGAWVPRQIISVPETPFTLSLQAFPVATLHGGFENPKGSQLPQSVIIAMYDLMALARGS